MSDLWIILLTIALQGTTLLFILYHMKNRDKLSITEWRDVANKTRKDLQPLIQNDLQEAVDTALKPILSSLKDFDKVVKEISELTRNSRDQEVVLTQVISHISVTEQELSQIMSHLKQLKILTTDSLTSYQSQVHQLGKKLDNLDAEMTAYSIEVPKYGGRR